jgi:hypothetical protein
MDGPASWIRHMFGTRTLLPLHLPTQAEMTPCRFSGSQTQARVHRIVPYTDNGCTLLGHLLALFEPRIICVFRSLWRVWPSLQSHGIGVYTLTNPTQ